MNKFFPEIKKNFGFGCMRFPMKGGKVDLEQTRQMVDLFMESGFNFYDTAHGYLNGQSETALKECLTSRYPRESYVLSDKLTHGLFTKSPEGIRQFFDKQLQACGVDYFDFYMMHAQNGDFFKEFKECEAYETAFALKAEGKIRHVGISFHDRAEVLEQILSEYPQIELVIMQFNYADWEDAGVQSRLCYQTCERHNVPIAVMEPVKGGSLAHLPKEAQDILDALTPGAAVKPSAASYAIRFAASFPNNIVVLSGMSSLEQMRDNLGFMKDFKPLSQEEFAAIDKVRGIFRSLGLIQCTACRYCTDGCPMNIPIPDLFADLNAKEVFHNWNSKWYYDVHVQQRGKAGDCIECGQCESVCPQKLPIIDLLKKVSKAFD